MSEWKVVPGSPWNQLRNASVRVLNASAMAAKVQAALQGHVELPVSLCACDWKLELIVKFLHEFEFTAEKLLRTGPPSAGPTQSC